MSIANVYLPQDRQRALVVTDTLIAVKGKPAGHGAKFLLLPHLPALLAYRGAYSFGWIAGQHVTLAHYQDFDALCTLLPDLCCRAEFDHIAQAGPLEGAAEPELIGVGLGSNGYRAVAYAHPHFAPVEIEPGCHPAPAPPGFHVPAGEILPTTDDFIALAEAQLAQTLADGIDPTAVGTGGSLILVELGSDGSITARKIHELGSYVGDPAAALRRSAWWKTSP